MTRTAFIHIGMMKCGSTAIQEYLSAVREPLAAEGFRFLSTPGHKSQFRLVAYAVDRHILQHRRLGLENVEDINQWQKGFASEIENEILEDRSDIIVSCENLASVLKTENEIEKLRMLILDHVDQCRVVLYVRDQSAAIPSFYSTQVRNGEARPLWPLEKRRYRNRFDYLPIVERWAKVFGYDALIVREFERSQLLNGSVTDDFLGVLGARISAVEAPMNVNSSLGHTGTEVLRRLNQAMDDSGGSNDRALQMSDIHSYIEAVDNSPPNRLTVDDIEEVKSWYSIANDRLKKLYGIDLNARLDERQKSAPTSPPQYNDGALEDAAWNIFGRAWQLKESKERASDCDRLISTAGNALKERRVHDGIGMLERAIILGDPTGRARAMLAKLRN